MTTEEIILAKAFTSEVDITKGQVSFIEIKYNTKTKLIYISYVYTMFNIFKKQLIFYFFSFFFLQKAIIPVSKFLSSAMGNWN